MRHATSQDVLRVVSQASRVELLAESLDEWFSQNVVGRLLWLAGNSDARLGGMSVQAKLEAVCQGGDRVAGWTGTLVSTKDGTVLFQHWFPLTIFHSTAVAVGQQYRPLLGDGRVVYWVQRCAIDGPSLPSAESILFDEEHEETVVVPQIATRPEPNGEKLLAAHPGVRPDARVLFREPAWSELLAGVARCEPVELAWAGRLQIWRSADRGILCYDVGSLQPLASPDATAALCPIRPTELADVLGRSEPIAFVHSHLLPADHGGSPFADDYLAASQDDLRSFHRLAVGSLALIVAGSPPFAMRAYGWPVDRDEFTELSVEVLLADEGSRTKETIACDAGQ